MNKKDGFTLMELMIVIAIIGLAAAFMFAFLNPFEQIKKARDNRRQKDLRNLKVSFEDFYNNKNCYPKPSEVCYNNASNENPCFICGQEASSPSLPNNLKLPCDPAHPDKQYLYHAEDSDCPQWYRVYSELQYQKDPVIAKFGCYAGGCGPANDYSDFYPLHSYGYDYGVSSPNVELENSGEFYCYTDSPSCDNCNPPLSENPYQYCLDNEGCKYKDKIYSSWQGCCDNNPIACP